MVLYGEPDLVFPQLANTGTQLIRVNLWWAGPGIRVATRRPQRPADPNDPAYNWDTVRPDGALLDRQRDAARLLDHRDAAVGERREGLERRADERAATCAASRPPRSGATAARS